jgi:hypothetical protein
MGTTRAQLDRAVTAAIAPALIPSLLPHVVREKGDRASWR